MQDQTNIETQPQSVDQASSNCIKCGYDIAALDITGNCPECGTPIINGCISCGYDLNHTAPDSNCPECGVPVWCSAARGALGAVNTEDLRSIHTGFRLATQLILAYIIFSIVAMIMAFAVFAHSDDTVITIALVASALLMNGLVFGIIFGWFKLSRKMPGIPDELDRPDRRKFLHVTLWIVTALTAIQTVWAFFPDQSFSDPNAEFGTADLIALIFQGVYLIAILASFVAQVMYVGWFAKLVRNRKMERRAKHLVWSGPLIALAGSFLFMLGPLIALILYWNLIEYVRRDLKKIIKART